MYKFVCFKHLLPLMYEYLSHIFKIQLYANARPPCRHHVYVGFCAFFGLSFLSKVTVTAAKETLEPVKLPSQDNGQDDGQRLGNHCSKVALMQAGLLQTGQHGTFLTMCTGMTLISKHVMAPAHGEPHFFLRPCTTSSVKSALDRPHYDRPHRTSTHNNP